MPEAPDFASVARRTLIEADGLELEAAIANQLRLMWNARGAADIARIDHDLSSMMSARYVKNLDRALRTLDR